MDKKRYFFQKQESISKAYFSQIHIFLHLLALQQPAIDITIYGKNNAMIGIIGIIIHPRIKSTKAK